jgi:hypothetical protein
LHREVFDGEEVGGRDDTQPWRWRVVRLLFESLEDDAEAGEGWAVVLPWAVLAAAAGAIVAFAFGEV